MFFGSQILIFYAVEFFAALNNTCRSDRTIALLFLYNSVATKLMYRLICNLPELSIRIFNPLASYSYLIGMNCGSQILILHAVG